MTARRAGQRADQTKQSRAKSFVEVLNAELDEVSRKRPGVAESVTDPNAHPDQVIQRAHRANLIALAFSGGGIRSATFNLGVLQGLAKLKLLKRFDYLSTVSGGGYIGGWLEAWIKRKRIEHVEDGLQPSRGERGLTDSELANKETQEIRFLREYSNYLTPRLGLLGADTWTAVGLYLGNVLLNQIILILSLSAILLLPRLAAGLLDCKPLAGNCVVALALALLTAAAAVIVYECQGLSDLADPANLPQRDGGQAFVVWTEILLVLVPLWLLMARYANAYLLHREQIGPVPKGPGTWAMWGTIAYCSVWLVGWLFAEMKGEYPSLRANAVRPWRKVRSRLVIRAGSALIAGLILGLLLYCFARLFNRIFVNGTSQIWHLAIWGLPLMVAALLISAVIHVGLLGLLVPGTRREWWGRAVAWLLILSGSWAGISTLAIYSPILVAWVGRRRWGGGIRWGAALAWFANTGFGVFGGKNPHTGAPSSGRWWERLLPMTAYIFVLGLLVVLSFGIHWTLGKATIANADARIEIANQTAPPETQKFPWALKTQERMAAQNRPSDADWAELAKRSAQTSFQAFFRKDWTESIAPLQLQLFEAKPAGAVAGGPSAAPGQQNRLQPTWNLLNASLYGLWPVPGHTLHLWPLFIWTGALFGLAVLLSSRVNINEFSMHRFYRNRLVRCYLGASRAKERRRPNPFTGFDPADDMELTDLQDGNDKNYDGPFPLINTTLNLVKGQDLAWQERKAESFVLSPLHCGFDVWLERRDGASHSENNLEEFGYRPTGRYAYPHGGFYLGTAMGVSGAAVSPNMGYHSSPALAFLMTMFNVRLGFWAGNPRRSDTWDKPGPKVGLFRLLAELFGATDDTSRYVYLSDGGHFDNLGIYELVKRHCKFIVACDASADPNHDFGDLGNAIEKCRIDMGVDIEIDIEQLRCQKDTGLSPWHCAVGRIRYDKADTHAPLGTLVYLKPSLTGDEPADVRRYKAQHREFPHQTTADQWFDESQFESYRALGQHILTKSIEAACDRAEIPVLSGSVEDLFVLLSQRWYPPSPSVAAAFTRHTATYSRLLEKMASDSDLRFLDPQLYPEWPKLVEGSLHRPTPDEVWLPSSYEERRAGFYFCNQMIQLTEDVYVDLNLEQEYDHPDNRGWMNLFRHWAWSGMFIATWAISAGMYGARFQRFCERRLDLRPGRVEII